MKCFGQVFAVQTRMQVVGPHLSTDGLCLCHSCSRWSLFGEGTLASLPALQSVVQATPWGHACACAEDEADEIFEAEEREKREAAEREAAKQKAQARKSVTAVFCCSLVS